MSSKVEIKKILKEEIGLLFDNLKTKMPSNYKKKRENFLLSPLSESQKAFMTFVSSFESQLGNAMNIIVRRIAILRYGVQCVPELILPDGTPSNNSQYDGRKEQVIMSSIDIGSAGLKGEITKFITRKERNKKENKPCSLGAASLGELYDIAQRYKTNINKNKKTDLLIFADGKWLIFEIKAGGGLDSTKGKGDIEKLMLEFVALNKKNALVFYSTLYSTNTGKKIKGDEARYINSELIKIEKGFWDLILPIDISFEEFKNIYNESLKEFKIQLQIEKLIEDVIL